jgi:hypothetical protein
MGLPLENGLCHLKKHQESIGCLSILETCRMLKFLEIPLFYVKFHIFIENVKKVVAEFAKIQFPAPARPGCARPYKTNAIPSLFRGSWRPGAHFRKKSHFHKIITKIEKSDFLADFSFLMKIMISAKSAGLQKHQYSLSFINGFGGSMARKMQNPLNLLKCLYFSEISRNSIILCEFQYFQ